MEKTEVLENPQEEVVEEVVQPATATPVVPPQEEKPNILKRFWYLFVILGVMIIVSLAILVYASQKLRQEEPVPLASPTPIPTISEEEDMQTSSLEEQGTSDETDEIEADLEATDLSGIDQELEDIDSEFSSP